MSEHRQEVDRFLADLEEVVAKYEVDLTFTVIEVGDGFQIDLRLEKRADPPEET